METMTIIYLSLGILALLVVAWAIWKFFKSLFKYFAIAVVVIALGIGLTIYSLTPPPRNPAIGKHAYLKENGRYLGVVESMGEDARRGPIWGIRQPSGYPTIYGRSRVILKEKYEPPPSPTPDPSPTASPEKTIEKKKKASPAKK
jgi:hypothetical protein